MPGLDFLGLGGDVVERLLADFGIGIGQQRGDGGDVERAGDGFADLGADRPAPGDGGENLLGLGGGDQLHQVGVGEQRRVFEDRRGDQRFDVARQRQHDEFGNAVERLDLFGQDGAHAADLVARQALQRLDGQGADMLAIRGGKVRHETGDLARQLGADVVIGIVGDVAVGVGGRGNVGRDRAARRRRAVLGQIMQHLGPGIGAPGQLAMRDLAARLQQGERLVPRHVGRRFCPRGLA